jgi:hypothetical protein
VYAPRFLQKREIESFRLKKDHLWLIIDPESLGASICFAAIVSFLWPLAVPIWLWSEVSSKKEKEVYLEQRKFEEEKKKNDPYCGLTIEQKIEKLKKLSGEV